MILPSASGVFYLPLLVFVAETSVVTLSTVRTIFITRGWRVLAPILGFFEVSIWLFAIGQVMQNLTRMDCFLAFAGGFSLGNYLGILIEKKLALGDVLVRITTENDASALLQGLKAVALGVTALAGQGPAGPVQVVFTVIKRKELEQVVSIIKTFDWNASYSVNDLQSADGVFPAAKRRAHPAVSAPLVQVLRVAGWRGERLGPAPVIRERSGSVLEDASAIVQAR